MSGGSEHTPGPWHASEGRVWDSAGGMICDLRNSPRASKAGANALLIALTPDLIHEARAAAALRDALQEMQAVKGAEVADRRSELRVALDASEAEAAALRERVAVLEASTLATRDRAAEAERENARLRAWIDDALEKLAQALAGAALAEALASVAEPQPDAPPVVVTVHV